MRPAPIEAVILDMDGLLIDTEPVWRRVEAETYGGLGVEVRDTEIASTMGVRVENSVRHWRRLRPWPGADAGTPSDAEIARQMIDRMVAHVADGGEPMPGVPLALNLLRRLGLPLAIASSSPRRLIDAVCERLGLDDIAVRCSADDEARGKPAPDVYLRAAVRLDVHPRFCLAFEDSPYGVLAAVAAGMRCLAVPDPVVAGDPRFGLVDLRLGSLEELDESVLRRLGWRS